MATVKDITSMCKAGNVAEAYKAAKADLDASPQDVWKQREKGWALYYMLKMDIEKEDNTAFIGHFEELTALDQLTMESDSLIFENVLWKLAGFVKTLPENSVSEMDKLFSLFSKYAFAPSKEYSYLLQSCLRFGAWERMVDFLEWWNLDNLSPDDFQQFKNKNGRKLMSLAERAYIAYSKALLRRGDKEKIRDFLPKIEKIAEDHPDMMYPGYYCGKLMLAAGEAKEDALKMLMPFVRKKQSDFWIWQLLSEIYSGDPNMRLACLLRAVHCKNQEERYLVKVRKNLASIYLSRKDYGRAKYHIDRMVRCYAQDGNRPDYEVQNWLRESWMRNAVANNSDGMDYKKLTDAILLNGTNESIAVVTYVDIASKRATLVYGEKKRAVVKLQKLKVRVAEGTLLRIGWLPAQNDKIDIIGAELVNPKVFVGNEYVKQVSSSIIKRADKPFAFIMEQGIKYFISPAVVQKHNLGGGEVVTAVAVYDFNKKRNEWTWACVSVKCDD